MARIFKYNDNTYADPGAEFSIEDVRVHLTQFFPELAQATHSEKTLDDGTVEITYAKKVGVKGAEVAHRWRVEGDVVFLTPLAAERYKTLNVVIEAVSEEKAIDAALIKYQLETGLYAAHWDYDCPPEAENLGEVPMDVIMRRSGQPMLPGVPA